MPTADRRAFVPSAIRYFLRQDYEPRELIVLDDGTESVADLIPPDERVRYVRLVARLTIGAKRNLACEQARGEIIAHWDDDDWIAEWRLTYQTAGLLRGDSDVCGLDSIFYFNLVSGEAWRYLYPNGSRPWLAGNTLCYWKRVWRECPFPAVNVGEDARFLWGGRPKRLLPLPDSDFCVAFIHPRNTSPKHTHDRMWHAVQAQEVQKIMGSDWHAVMELARGVGAPRTGA